MAGPSTVLYASDLAVSALGLKPEGAPWAREATHCACCGRPILPGDKAVRDSDRFGPSFTDGPSLACKGSGAVCGACSTIMNAAPLRALQCAVITEREAYPIGKDVNRSWFLLEPPEPPYVVVVSDTNQAHLVWRTPVTVDNNLVVVRLGARLMRIRRAILEQAVKDCLTAANAVNERRESSAAKGRKATVIEGLRHPFVRLSRELDDARHGVLRHEVAAAAESEPESAVGSAVRRLLALGTGELWALATLVKRKPAEPERPEPIRLS